MNTSFYLAPFPNAPQHQRQWSCLAMQSPGPSSELVNQNQHMDKIPNEHKIHL